jgi:tight adherence protein C
MEEYIFLSLVAIFVGGVTMMAYLALVKKRERVQARLEHPSSPSDPAIGSTPELVLGPMTESVAGAIPTSEEGRSELNRELRSAGFYRPTALMEYAAVRTILTIGPLILAGIIALLFTESTSAAVKVWIGGIIVALLGFSLPRVYLHLASSARKAAIERGLPTAIDMLTLCLSAGLNVFNSLERVAGEVALAYPDLAYELHLVRRQADMRSLEFALVQFAERINLPQLRNVGVILSQSEKLGSEGVTVLREYADNMRVQMRQNAETAANKTPLKMLFPAYMMGLGIMILMIIPPTMEIASFTKDNVVGDLKKEGLEGIQKAGLSRQPGQPTAPPEQ